MAALISAFGSLAQAATSVDPVGARGPFQTPANAESPGANDRSDSRAQFQLVHVGPALDAAPFDQFAGHVAAPVSIGNVRLGGTVSLNSVAGPATPHGVTTYPGANGIAAGNGASIVGRLPLAGITGTSNHGTISGAFAGSLTPSYGIPPHAFTSGSGGTITQSVGFNANVFQVAQPNLPASLNFGNMRVGSTPAAQTVTIGSTLNAPTGFQEGLNTSLGALTGAATAGGGPIVNLAGGATSNALSVGIAGVAGANSGTVAVNFASNGTGTSGLATFNLPAGSIGVTGQDFILAAGQLNTASLNFGQIQVGQSVSQVLSSTNSATGLAGFVEDLAAAFGASADLQISGTGSITGLLGGATNASAPKMNVNTAAAGTLNGTIVVNYTSAAAINGVSNGFATQAVGSISDPFTLNFRELDLGSILAAWDRDLQAAASVRLTANLNGIPYALGIDPVGTPTLFSPGTMLEAATLATPLPATGWLLLAGLAVLGALGRKPTSVRA